MITGHLHASFVLSSLFFPNFVGGKNIIGSKIRIYSLDPSTQWFTAVVVNGNPATRTLEVNCQEVGTNCSGLQMDMGNKCKLFIYISTNTIFISVFTVIFKHEYQCSAEQYNPKCFFMLLVDY